MVSMYGVEIRCRSTALKYGVKVRCQSTALKYGDEVPERSVENFDAKNTLRIALASPGAEINAF